MAKRHTLNRLSTAIKEEVKSDFPKEALIYLRRVHSWLVVVSAAIVLTSVANIDLSLEASIHQIRSINRVSSEWDARFFQKKAAETVEKTRSLLKRYWPNTLHDTSVFFLKIQGEVAGLDAVNLPVHYYGLGWTLRGKGGIILPEDSRGPHIPGIEQSVRAIDRPQTLGEFEDIWNSLNKKITIQVLALPKSPLPVRLYKVRSIKGSSFEAVAQWKPLKKEADSADPAFRAILRRPSEASNRSFAERYYTPIPARGAHNLQLYPPEAPLDFILTVVPMGSSSPILGKLTKRFEKFSPWGVELRVDLPVDTYRIPFPAQKLLRNMIDASLPLGSFESSFPDLSRRTKGLRNLPLDDLSTYLEQQRANVHRSVQLLGLSFPVSTLSTWGAAFLAIIQIYFCVSLRAILRDREVRKQKYPWIALYEDLFSKIFFFSSAIIVPVFVVLYLSYPVIFADVWTKTTWLILAISAASVMSGLLSGYIYYDFLRSRRRISM